MFLSVPSKFAAHELPEAEVFRLSDDDWRKALAALVEAHVAMIAARLPPQAC
jgi:hypothetical protein